MTNLLMIVQTLILLVLLKQRLQLRRLAQRLDRQQLLANQ
jgi:hypothetical protein